jgi:hypothetical protein
MNIFQYYFITDFLHIQIFGQNQSHSFSIQV